MRAAVRLLITVGIAGALALGGVIVSSAAGSQPAPAAVMSHASLALPPGAGHARQTASPPLNTSFIAGYAAFQAGPSSDSSTFKIPKLTCTSTDSGIAPGSFIFAGPVASETLDGAGVLVQCLGGAQVNSAALIVGSIETNFANKVNPGDTVQTIVSVGAGGTSVSIKDLTTARAFTLSQTGSDTASDVELIGVDSVVSAGTQLPVPAFTGAKFTASTVGGAPIGSLTPTKVLMVSGCEVLLTPGAIDGTGMVFSVTIPKVNITSITPTSGTTGTVVAIAGIGFNSSSSVKFAGTAATTLTHDSATLMHATVPLSASTGAILVQNTAAPLGAITSACVYTVTPKITSFTPASGITGSSVTINGSGFKGTQHVTFGTRTAAFTFVSPTQLKATVPNGAVAGTITVTTTAGVATSAGSFTPTLSITGVNPQSGPFGTVVTISGKGFNSGSTVKFNGTAATAVSHVSSTQLKATVPPAATTGPITVTNTATPVGTVRSAPNYTVTPHVAPTVTSFTPPSGITGSSVTITGTSFSGASAVKFGTHAAHFTITSATQIAATVPNGATVGTISVTTAAGTGTSAATFSPTLSITGFTPTSGGAGTVVTINGVGFNASSTVKFNGTASTGVTLVSATQLKATVPTGVTTGPVSVTNTTAPVGTVRSAANFT